MSVRGPPLAAPSPPSLLASRYRPEEPRLGRSGPLLPGPQGRGSHPAQSALFSRLLESQLCSEHFPRPSPPGLCWTGNPPPSPCRLRPSAELPRPRGPATRLSCFPHGALSRSCCPAPSRRRRPCAPSPSVAPWSLESERKLLGGEDAAHHCSAQPGPDLTGGGREGQSQHQDRSGRA